SHAHTRAGRAPGLPAPRRVRAGATATSSRRPARPAAARTRATDAPPAGATDAARTPLPVAPPRHAWAPGGPCIVRHETVPAPIAARRALRRVLLSGPAAGSHSR